MTDDSPLRAEITALGRTTWIPVVDDSDGGLTDSKFGGRPWLGEDEDWPTCPNCEQPMQHFVQLNLAQLPEAERERLGDKGLIQLFYCTSYDPLCEDECEAYFPFAESVVARFVETPSPTANETAEGPEDAFEAKRIVEWQPREDLPSVDEIWEIREDLELTEEEEDYLFDHEMTAAGDKLGGWPYWIQNVEYPSCSECGETMEFVLQIDSEINVPKMFGDSGAGHLSRCPNHPDVLAFAWACC